MSNLESQMWCLNERYGVLSASYTALREKIEKYQTHSGVGPQLSSLQKVSDNPHWNIPLHPIPAAEPGSTLVKTISYDSQRQQFEFKGPSDPRRIFSNAIRDEQSNKMKIENTSNLCEENKFVDQERNRRKLHSNVKPDIGRLALEGEGLDAIAAAASIISRKPFLQASPTASRNSLAVLYAACFNATESAQHPALTVMKSH